MADFRNLAWINQDQTYKEFTQKLFMFIEFQGFIQINWASHFKKEIVIGLTMN